MKLCIHDVYITFAVPGFWIIEYQLFLYSLAIARYHMSSRDETHEHDTFYCSQSTASFEFIIFECTIVWIRIIMFCLGQAGWTHFIKYPDSITCINNDI